MSTPGLGNQNAVIFTCNSPNVVGSILNSGISILEVMEAVKLLNRKKAVGTDQLPADVVPYFSCTGYFVLDSQPEVGIWNK